MGKGYNPRKEGTRKAERKVYIVCEGKTEQNYFTGLRTRNSGVEIIPVYGKCTDPKSIIDFAQEKMNNKWSIDLDEGDGVWCAFDVDENTNQALTEAKAKAKDIQIALSNPCFELWLLLHYKTILSQISREEALQELKKFIKYYDKGKNISPLLAEKTPIAITNAKRLNQIHYKNKVSLIGRESNPSTQVFKLVEFIEQLSKKKKG